MRPSDPASRREAPITVLQRLLWPHGLLRARDARALGIPPSRIRLYVDIGWLRQVGRGLYGLPEGRPSLHALVAKRFRGAVLCLRSALWVHGVLDAEPEEVWLAIGHGDRAPTPEGLPLQVVRFSGAAWREALEPVARQRVAARVYGLEKTVVDCFRLRARVGTGTAVHALHTALGQGRTTPDALRSAARRYRAASTLEPHLAAWEARQALGPP